MYLAISSVIARPQLNSFTSSSNCDTRVKCQRTETAPGVYSFNCIPTNPCVIQREDILWLKGTGQAQQLNVVVPNYRLEEVIKAAFKSTAGAGTNVNILLKRPQQSVDAEADVSIPPASAPEVNLEYEPIPSREVVHYPVDRPYRPLSGRILEP